jgi:hypothetical protein
MSTPQHLELPSPTPKDGGATPSVWADQHPFFPQEKAPVLLAQNAKPQGIGEGPGNPTPPGQPTPPGKPPGNVGEGPGKNPVTVNQTTDVNNTNNLSQQQKQNQEQTSISNSTSNSKSDATSTSNSKSNAVSGSTSDATGGNAKAAGGNAKSSSIGEGGQGGNGGTGGTGTGGSNAFTETSNSKETVLIPAPILTEQGGACPGGWGVNALGGVAGFGITKTGQQTKCLDYQEREHTKTVDANVQIQTTAINASKEASEHAADKQAEISVQQGQTAVDLRNIQNKEVTTEQKCNYAAIFGDKAYTGYNNIETAGKELKTNPMASGVIDSQKVLTTNFAVGSSQLIKACADSLGGDATVAGQFGPITAKDLTPVVVPPTTTEAPKKVVTNRAIPRPHGCSDDPTVLRGFIALHKEIVITPAEKKELTDYFAANKKATPTEQEKKLLGIH